MLKAVLIFFQAACLEKLGFYAKSDILNDHIPCQYNTEFSHDLSAVLITLQYYLHVADTRHTCLPQILNVNTQHTEDDQGISQVGSVSSHRQQDKRTVLCCTTGGFVWTLA